MGKDVKDRWVEVGGLRVHLLVAGEANAPPILLLHGGGYDSASLSYGKSIGPVSRNNKVFAPDWPGYGRSGKPKIRYSTGYYVDFLGRLMDVLGLEQSSLVGISMGGAISLGFALRSPRRVEKLVLVDSHGLGREVPWRPASYAVARLPLLNKAVWAALRRSRGMVEQSLRTVFSIPGSSRGASWTRSTERRRNRGRGGLGDPGRATRSSGLRTITSTGCTIWRCRRSSSTGRKTSTCLFRGR